MSNTFKTYPKHFVFELILSILCTFILIVITYYFSGGNGLKELIEGYNEQFKSPNLINLAILLFIGLLAWFLHYYFNFKHKQYLKKLSDGLLDVCINLLRIGGGVMISLAILICIAGSTYQLSTFIPYGFLAIAEATFFSMLKDNMLNIRK